MHQKFLQKQKCYHTLTNKMNSQEYIEIRIAIEPFSEENAEIIMAETCELPFESFVTEDPYLKCYIQKELYDPRALKLYMNSLNGYEFKCAYTATLIPPSNWNAEWEKNARPITIDNRCTIKAPFHTDLPKTRFNITIEPKMAFGDGHHQTTNMMCRALLDNEEAVRGKVVMDMGCGTAVLAILAAKMKATKAYGIDIDAVAAISAHDNAKKNRVGKIVQTYCGDASLLQRKSYDILLANINRNILIQDMPTYSKSLRDNGLLFVSGFYMEDLPLVRKAAESEGLEFCSNESDEDWCCAKFRKILKNGRKNLDFKK